MKKRIPIPRVPMNESVERTDRIEKTEPLLEMAYGRKEFIIELRHKTIDIIRNFALIKYAKQTKTHESLINHWKRELITPLQSIRDMQTLPKPNNRALVERACKQEWYTKAELDTHPEFVVHKFETKFEDENIELSDKEKYWLANEFIKYMPTLIYLMSYSKTGEIRETIDKL